MFKNFPEHFWVPDLGGLKFWVKTISRTIVFFWVPRSVCVSPKNTVLKSSPKRRDVESTNAKFFMHTYVYACWYVGQCSPRTFLGHTLFFNRYFPDFFGFDGGHGIFPPCGADAIRTHIRNFALRARWYTYTYKKFRPAGLTVFASPSYIYTCIFVAMRNFLYIHTHRTHAKFS